MNMLEPEASFLRSTKAAWHLLVWVLAATLPVLLLPSASLRQGVPLFYYLIPLFLCVPIFYLNYFCLSNWIRKQGWSVVWSIAANAILILMAFGVEQLLRSQVFPDYQLSYRYGIAYAVVGLLANQIRQLEISGRLNLDRVERDRQNLSAELQFLRFQLQPHFFFNSLNEIYTIVDYDKELAKEMIYGLGKLMRYLIYEARAEQVQLRAEVDFIQQYLQFMRLRLSDRHQIETHFPEQIRRREIAPLLLIPLVENAFKHGVSKLEPGTICIRLQVDEKQLLFSVENPDHAQIKSGNEESGIGLANLRKRLQLLYPEHELHAERTADGRFRAELRLWF